MTELLSAIATALIIILTTWMLSKKITAPLIATSILCSIAFIYVGFSLKENTVNAIVLEVLIALIFFFIAVIGFVRNHSLIAYGIILHGVWDIFHHKAIFIQTNIPDYWPLYCSIVDLICGICFLLLFRSNRITNQPVIYNP